MRALLGLLGEQDPVVGEDPHGVAAQLGPAADQRAAVQRLELLEARTVDDPREDLTHLERGPHVGAGDAEELLGVVDRRVGYGAHRRRAALAPPEVRDDVAALTDRVELVDGEVVREAAGAGVHVGAAELLLVGVLVDRHLHQGWPAEEDAGRAALQDRVVAHAGQVGAAGRRAAEDHGDRRDACG